MLAVLLVNHFADLEITKYDLKSWMTDTQGRQSAALAKRAESKTLSFAAAGSNWTRTLPNYGVRMPKMGTGSRTNLAGG